MAQQLQDLKLDEVSLVEEGANRGARVVFAKNQESLRGVRFLVGMIDAKKTSAVSSVLFDPEEWTEDSAKEWLESNGMKVTNAKTLSEGTLSFLQNDPSGFDRFRFVTPGEQIGKALRGSQSWHAVQHAIIKAVRDKFASSDDESSPWVRDFWQDNVIVENRDDVLFRVPYSISLEGSDIRVNLGDPVEAELVYLDKVRSSSATTISASALIQLGRAEVLAESLAE